MRNGVIRHKADRGEGESVLLVGLVVLGDDADDAAVVTDDEVVHIVAVYVAVDPVEKARGLACGKVDAVEVDAAGIVCAVIPAAGVDIIGIVGQRQLLAEGLAVLVNDPQLVPALAGPDVCGNAAVAEPAHALNIAIAVA